jgi:hypothetical protein
VTFKSRSGIRISGKVQDGVDAEKDDLSANLTK